MERRLTLAHRVTHLEAELAYLRAIVDGGEVQAREAIVAVIGLMASFAVQAGALDYDRLIAFLSNGSDRQPDPEDRTEILIHGVRLILAYHREQEKGGGEPPIPAPASLGPEENRALLARAIEMVDFESGTPPTKRGRLRGDKGGSHEAPKH